MGHAQLGNFSELITKFLYTGKKSVREIIEYAIKKKCWVQASEGAYPDDEGMTAYGVETVLSAYFKPDEYFYPKHVLATPIPVIEIKGEHTSEQWAALAKWWRGDIEFSSDDYEVFMAIKIGYTPIGRELYLTKKLPMVTGYTT